MATRSQLDGWTLAKIPVEWRPGSAFHLATCRHAPPTGDAVRSSFEMAARLGVPPCLTCIGRRFRMSVVMRTYAATIREAYLPGVENGRRLTRAGSLGVNNA